MVVRAMRIEIFQFAKDSGRRERWKELAVSCQEMTNTLWQVWLVHHRMNGSAGKLRNHFAEYSEWEKTKQGAKPEWPCKALEHPLTLSSSKMSFYRILSSEFPQVNVRTRGLLTNAWQSRLTKRKAAKGNLPGWVSILFAKESMPSTTRPQPIPFDHDNAKLTKVDGRYLVELRIERLGDGKSVVEKCELMLRKRKAASLCAIMERILSGEFKWKGSSLILDNGKWYALICYDKPVAKRVTLDADKTLFVRPGRFNVEDRSKPEHRKTGTPWRVKIGSWSSGFGGNGKHVEFARRSVQRERAERKEHYRWAGSNQKGSGRLRADAAWTKLSSRWKDFTKRYNNEVTRRLIDLAIKNGCGRIVYLQPKDRQRDYRFLSRAGNIDDSPMTWDYFQFGTILASKCEEDGIEYGRKAKKEKSKNIKPATANSVRNLRKADAAVNKKHSGKTPSSVR